MKALGTTNEDSKRLLAELASALDDRLSHESHCVARWPMEMNSVASLRVAHVQALEVRIREQEIVEYALRKQREPTRRLFTTVER